MSFSEELIARARRIRLFICDVDGVLTDATVSMGGAAETKVFHIRDGLGLRLLQTEASIRVVGFPHAPAKPPFKGLRI